MADPIPWLNCWEPRSGWACRGCRLGFHRHAASYDFVQDDAECIYVGSDRCPLSIQQFGGHVRWGATFGRVHSQNPGQSEVHNHDPQPIPCGRGKHDVAAFQVTMDDSDAMGGYNSGAELARDFEGLFLWQLAVL